MDAPTAIDVRRPVLRIGLAAALGLGLFAGGATLVGAHDANGTSPVAPRPALPASAAMPASDLQGAIAQLQQRVRAFPSDTRAVAQLGGAYVQQARVTADPTLYPLAERAFTDALDAAGPPQVDALVGMGTLALARHAFADALEWGRRARALAPFDADVYGVIGDAEIELGHYEEAFRTFQTMVDTRPDLASYARVSYARELQGDVDGASSAMRQALRAAGTPADAAWASYQLGELAFGRGDVDAAASWYRRATALAPEYVPPFAGLAKVAWARGRIDRAIAGYREVVERYPAPEHVVALADLYRTTGRDRLADRAESLVRAEERLFRANGVDVDLELALFEADHGDPASAVAAARAEWRRRRSIHVADALAWSLSQAGRSRAAEPLMRRALAIGTRSAPFLFHDAVIHHRLGEDETAARLLRGALAINPNFSILYADRARALLDRLGSGR